MPKNIPKNIRTGILKVKIHHIQCSFFLKLIKFLQELLCFRICAENVQNCWLLFSSNSRRNGTRGNVNNVNCCVSEKHWDGRVCIETSLSCETRNARYTDVAKNVFRDRASHANKKRATLETRVSVAGGCHVTAGDSHVHEQRRLCGRENEA